MNGGSAMSAPVPSSAIAVLVGMLAGLAMGWGAARIQRQGRRDQGRSTVRRAPSPREGNSSVTPFAGRGAGAATPAGGDGVVRDDVLIDLAEGSDITGLRQETLRGGLICRMQVSTAHGTQDMYYSRRDAVRLRRTLRRKKALAFDEMMGERDQWNV